MKLVKGVSSAITSFGSTKAPMLYSFLPGEAPNPVEEREVRSTLAKWVGTATVGMEEEGQQGRGGKRRGKRTGGCRVLRCDHLVGL
jgi:hypothetical protein